MRTGLRAVALVVGVAAGVGARTELATTISSSARLDSAREDLSREFSTPGAAAETETSWDANTGGPEGPADVIDRILIPPPPASAVVRAGAAGLQTANVGRASPAPRAPPSRF